MILSMTGFGRGTAVRNGREITVELRSVNSRYFEYSSRHAPHLQLSWTAA